VTVKSFCLVAIALGLAPTAFAGVLYYAGDPNGYGGVVSGTDGMPFNGFETHDARLYDDFVVPAGGWTITGFGGNFVTEAPLAYWPHISILTLTCESSDGLHHQYP
jgi:hypothetical protein